MAQFPEQFFEAVVPMLRGESTPEDMLASLGPSPSGARRVGYYRTLMRRNGLRVVRSVFPALHHLISTRAPESAPKSMTFSELVEVYDRAHPPQHFEPNGWGELLPEFVEALVEEGKLPAGADQLADYEWLRYAVGVVEEVEEPLKLRPDAFVKEPSSSSKASKAIVRHYDFDVLSFSSALSRGEEPEPLRERPTALVIYRKAPTGQSVAFRPTLAELVELSVAAGTAREEHFQLVSKKQRIEAQRRLQKRRLLQKEEG